MAVIDKEKKKTRPARLKNLLTKEVSYVRKGAIGRTYPLLKSDLNDVDVEKAGNLPGDARPNAGKPIQQTAPAKPDASEKPQPEEGQQAAQQPPAAAPPATAMVLPPGSKASFQQALSAALDAFTSFAESVTHAPEAVEGQQPSPPELLITAMNKVGDLMGKALEAYPGLKISHGKPEPVAPTDDSAPDAADEAKPQENPMAKSQELLAECDQLDKELELAGKLLGKLLQPRAVPAEVAKSDEQKPAEPAPAVDVQAITKAAVDAAVTALDAKYQSQIQSLTAEVNKLGSRTVSSAASYSGERTTVKPAATIPSVVYGDYNDFLAQEAAKARAGK